MPSKRSIPDDVQQRAEEVVERFNGKELENDEVRYVARFKGRHLYLDRCDYGTTGPICRLRYGGDLDDWEFAIYKFSKNTYDPDERFFPGSDAVDGTVEGAMVAGLEAYPP